MCDFFADGTSYFTDEFGLCWWGTYCGDALYNLPQYTYDCVIADPVREPYNSWPYCPDGPDLPRHYR